MGGGERRRRLRRLKISLREKGTEQRERLSVFGARRRGLWGGAEVRKDCEEGVRQEIARGSKGRGGLGKKD